MKRAAESRCCLRSTTGHYRIVVSDLDRGRPIWVGSHGCTEADFDAFFAALGLKTARIELAAMDMWKPFHNSLARNAPGPRIFDKFHIMRHLVAVWTYGFARVGELAPVTVCEAPSSPLPRTVPPRAQGRRAAREARACASAEAASARPHATAATSRAFRERVDLHFGALTRTPLVHTTQVVSPRARRTSPS